MTTPKLLGLLMEHLHHNDIKSFKVYNEFIVIDFDEKQEVIKFNKPLLDRYNKIFGYN